MCRARVPQVAIALAVSMAAMMVTAAPETASVNGGPQLTFPWGAPFNNDGSNSNGQFNYGPHDYNGIDTNQHNHSWNSLDLAPADSRVYAARSGTAYVECGGERIRVAHGDGYITTYLHLYPPSVRITSGSVVYRYTWLARFVLASDHYTQSCGTGTNHVHFSLWYVAPGDTFNYLDRQAVDWGGLQPTAAPLPGQTQIGDWTVDDGVPLASYSGCMARLESPGTRYCGLTQGVTTYIYNDWLSEQVPTARRPGGQTEDLFLRGNPLHAYQVPTDSNGNPTQGWTDLGGIVKGSPTGVWNATTTELDVFAIGTGDGIYYRRWFSSTGWEANWTLTTLIAGTAPTETVNSERVAGGGIDLFFQGQGGDAQVATLDSSLNVLGSPFSLGVPSGGGGGIRGAPSGRWNSSGTRLDVFVIGNDSHPYRRSEQCGYPACVWDNSWTLLPGTAASAGTSSSGITASVTEMVMAVRAPDDSVDLFFRGTSNDAFHETLDQYGNFLQSESLGGIIKGAPDAKWDAYKSRLDLFVIGTNDQVWQDTWTQGSNPPWSGWRLLSGGGAWG